MIADLEHFVDVMIDEAGSMRRLVSWFDSQQAEELSPIEIAVIALHLSGRMRGGKLGASGRSFSRQTSAGTDSCGSLDTCRRTTGR